MFVCVRVRARARVRACVRACIRSNRCAGRNNVNIYQKKLHAVFGNAACMSNMYVQVEGYKNMCICLFVCVCVCVCVCVFV